MRRKARAINKDLPGEKCVNWERKRRENKANQSKWSCYTREREKLEATQTSKYNSRFRIFFYLFFNGGDERF